MIYDKTSSAPTPITIYFFICNDLSASLSFFSWPLKKVWVPNRNIGQICCDIFFDFIILFTYSSLCSQDHFADKTITCDQPALLFPRQPTFVLFPKKNHLIAGPSLERPSLLVQVMWQCRFCKVMGQNLSRDKILSRDNRLNHNYNKIVKSDWLSTALISALIGQFNRTVRVMPK